MQLEQQKKRRNRYHIGYKTGDLLSNLLLLYLRSLGDVGSNFDRLPVWVQRIGEKFPRETQLLLAADPQPSSNAFLGLEAKRPDMFKAIYTGLKKKQFNHCRSCLIVTLHVAQFKRNGIIQMSRFWSTLDCLRGGPISASLQCTTGSGNDV